MNRRRAENVGCPMNLFIERRWMLNGDLAATNVLSFRGRLQTRKVAYQLRSLVVILNGVTVEEE